MNTSTLSKLRSNINNVTFKAGNVRSLAMSLTSLVEMADAWAIAKSVAKDYGKDFTTEDVLNFIYVKEKEIISNKEGKIKNIEPKIISSDSNVLSKNQVIRKMLAAGMSVSDIRKVLNLTYQRVKNIEKNIRRKTQEDLIIIS